MSRPTTRFFLHGAIPAAWIALCGSGVWAAAEPDASSRPGGKPNIIFIMADDLGYAHLGCYGQRKIRTPELDAFAAEGMRFTQCYAGAPVCAPSRSVLVTGMHCGHTSVRGNSGGIPLLAGDVTFAEVLKPAGYRTGVVGKWGLGRFGSAGVPNEQGFDRFFGYLHQVHCHFYYPYYLIDDREKFLLPGNEGGRREQYTHDVIVEKALEFVRDAKDRPFFLYLPFTIPHTELLVPEDSLREYRGKFPEPTPWVCSRRHYADQPTPRAAFAAMVTRMDRDVGRLRAVLGELGLDSNTIVFFTSDNGGQDGGGADLAFFDGNDPLRGSKGQVYEGGIRVPMIVRWPGHVRRGAVNDHVWAFCDVLPTLAELGGARTPAGLDGISAVPALLGAEAAGHSQQKHRFLYWEQPRGRGLAQGVRMGDWKAVRLKAGEPLELYDLEEDIGETTNVAQTHPEIVAEIEDYLKDARVAPRRYEAEPPAWGYPKEKTGYCR
jgi:arylsulfatase A